MCMVLLRTKIFFKLIKLYDDLLRTSFYVELINMIIKANENIDDSNINFLSIMNANK
jgi:hypothetical protein